MTPPPTHHTRRTTRRTIRRTSPVARTAAGAVISGLVIAGSLLGSGSGPGSGSQGGWQPVAVRGAVEQRGAEGADAAADLAAAADRARDAVAAGMSASGFPTGAVVVADRTTSSSRGIGRSDGRPITGDTPFVIGSASKSFTALAVMQLVDDGRVGLDDPVQRYVPEFALADPQVAARITVRQILQQTSGIPGTAGGPVLRSATDGDALAAVRELRGTAPTAAPGTTWQYANANYVLAGLVVERASGMPYGDHVQRRIFDPLGMTHSYTAAAPARADGLADGHRIWFGLPVATEPLVRPGLLAAGYLVSTANDLARYLHVLVNDGTGANGVRIVSARSLQTLLTPGPQTHLGSWADGATSRYALGWFVGGPWREAVTFHPGNSPDSTAMISFAPRAGLAVATLVAAGHETPLPGNPSAADRISRNAVAAALGEPVTTGTSVRQFSAWFDLVALLLVAAAGYPLARAVRTLGADRRGGGTGPRRGRRLLRTAAGLVLRSALVAVLLALPGATGYGWAALATWAPDLAVLVSALAALVLATAVVRLVCAALPRPATPTGTPSPTGPDVVVTT